MKSSILSGLSLMAVVAAAAPSPPVSPVADLSARDGNPGCSLTVQWKSHWKEWGLTRYRVEATVNPGDNAELKESGPDSWCEMANKYIKVWWLTGQNVKCWTDEKTKATTDTSNDEGGKGLYMYRGLMLDAAQNWQAKYDGCALYMNV